MGSFPHQTHYFAATGENDDVVMRDEFPLHSTLQCFAEIILGSGVVILWGI